MIVIYPIKSSSKNNIIDFMVYYTLHACNLDDEKYKCLFVTINKNIFKEQINIIPNVNFRFNTKFYKNEINKIYL